MQEITVLSGKGGTGKTSITAALASLGNNIVLCDSDVDAADLHLLLKPKIKETHNFVSSWLATIDQDKCSLCNSCVDICRFDAIHEDPNGNLLINPFKCEGCRLCERICPQEAISSSRQSNNYWYISDTRFGTMIHARMGAGEDNSGKLVSQVRTAAKTKANENNINIILNDGPPGIGCPVISALSGTDTVLIVIEPSKSGFHDAQRLFKLIDSFNAKVFAVINKYDINIETSNEIEFWLNESKIPLLAKIPFDTKMVKALLEEKTIIEYDPNSIVSKSLTKVWEKLTKH